MPIERMNRLQHGRKRIRIISWRAICISTSCAVAVLFISNFLLVHNSMEEISIESPLSEWRQRNKQRSRQNSEIYIGGGDSSSDRLVDMNSLHKWTVIDSTAYNSHENIHSPCNRREHYCGLSRYPIHSHDIPQHHSTKFLLDTMLRVTPGEEALSQKGHIKQDLVEGECEPMKPWQSQNYPTCNSIHEIDMKLFGGTNHINNVFEFRDDQTSILGKGWFRITWKALLGLTQETVVLKTLRADRDFFDEFYELHRKDAIAMERLTSSPYVLNIYSYCGQSVVNEFADFIDGFQDFKTFARRLGGNRELKVMKLKLQIATMLALGIMHIHELDGPNNPSMAHYDVNPMNVAVTKGGIPKFNDFNVAHFFKWNSRLNKRCGFYGRLHEPWWRSPEEMLQITKTEENSHVLDEKVDIYSLGNLIYMLLTGHSPRGQTDPNRLDEVRSLVQNGTPPTLDDFYNHTTEPLTAAMITALRICYEPNPNERGSAREIAGVLLQTLDEFNAIESSPMHTTFPTN